MRYLQRPRSATIHQGSMEKRYNRSCVRKYLVTIAIVRDAAFLSYRLHYVTVVKLSQ